MGCTQVGAQKLERRRIGRESGVRQGPKGDSVCDEAGGPKDAAGGSASA